MELFEYIKMLFSKNEKQWNSISTSIKRKNFWMLNRFMAIQFPTQVNLLSHYKIDPVAVSDYWHRAMSSKFAGTPKWVYAKTKKKTEEIKKLDLPSQNFITWYCEKNEMTKSDFMQTAFFYDSFLIEMKDLEKILKSQNVIE